MKKPKTFDKFESLIMDMDHRERYVFQMRTKYIEIYCTIKFNQSGHPRSYKFSYWNDDTEKPSNILKKYLRQDSLRHIYNQISS